MAYTYLTLTNDVARRLNETELTSSNFDTATGVYNSIKESINSSIHHMNQAHFFWPFNHNQKKETLTAGLSRYSIPDNAKYIDFNSFRLRRNTSLNVGQGIKLTQITYEEYLNTYIDQEYETDTTKGQAPRLVCRTPDREYIVVPMPDKAYEVDYEYYMAPTDLEYWDDIPTIPENYRHVIVDGAMYYGYLFRDNIEQASMMLRKFEAGIQQMRSILVNEYAYFRAN